MQAVYPQSVGEPGVANESGASLEEEFSSWISLDLAWRAWLQVSIWLVLANTSVRRCTPLSQPPNERYAIATVEARITNLYHEHSHNIASVTIPCALTGWNPCELFADRGTASLLLVITMGSGSYQTSQCVTPAVRMLGGRSSKLLLTPNVSTSR